MATVCSSTVGEANSGKASKSLAKITSGIGQLQEGAGSATSAIAHAKMVSEYVT
jgi:X-X-X-Leu-X-X-Gly heptad repeat protein